MIQPSSSHPGYIFLVSVLVIGAIASATAISLMLLGWAAEQNGLLVHQSAQAFEYAQTCAERTLRNLRNDPNHAGEQTYQFTHGSCTVEAIGGAGNEHRTLCISGLSGQNTRRLQIAVSELYPSVRIADWQEVASFTLCP